MDKVSTRVIRYEPGRRIPRHAHDETQVTLLISGQVREMVDNQASLIRALDVIVKPSGTEHENEFGSGESVSLQVSIPATVTNEFQSEGNGLLRWHQKLNPFLVNSFLDWAEQIGNQPSVAIHAPSRLRDMASKLSQRENHASRTVPGWLNAAMKILEAEFRQPITVNELAERCDVHPVSLNRACRKTFGETISQRKAMLRTQHAASLLADHRNSLAAIAVDCGFVDQSHLSRVFKSSTGRTPGQFRRLSRRLLKMARQNIRVG